MSLVFRTIRIHLFGGLFARFTHEGHFPFSRTKHDYLSKHSPRSTYCRHIFIFSYFPTYVWGSSGENRRNRIHIVCMEIYVCHNVPRYSLVEYGVANSKEKRGSVVCGKFLVPGCANLVRALLLICAQSRPPENVEHDCCRRGSPDPAVKRGDR